MGSGTQGTMEVEDSLCKGQNEGKGKNSDFSVPADVLTPHLPALGLHSRNPIHNTAVCCACIILYFYDVLTIAF